MTFGEWAADTRERIQRDGLHGMKRSVIELGIGGLRRLDRTFEFGTTIWDKDWDVLLILDACRADLMDEVRDEYEFVRPGSVTSLAGGSRSWMQRNFAQKYHEQTAGTIYVTGNPFSDEVLDTSWFYGLEEVWRYAWDQDLNTVPARAITDVAVSQWREHGNRADRMIVHYMQPHHPFVPDPMDPGMNREQLDNPEKTVWDRLRDGELNYDEVWEAYLDNLRYVLDDVELLLKSINAEAVTISADHGNALGEWYFYGHGDVPVPAVRQVPWFTTSASDTGEFESEIEMSDDNSSVEEKLGDLGYL